MIKKILITGSTGMVGRNLIENEELSLQYELLTPVRSELNLLYYNEVEKYLIDHKPDLIIHAAGIVGGIQANINSPVQFFMHNLDMGRNIVWAARQVGINNILNLGSSCMYPRNAENPLKEEYILKGELEPTNEGYALAKISTAKLCDYINREDSSYKYKTIVPCNLYGRWDKFNPINAHLIPAVIQKIYSAKENNEGIVTIWGDGSVRREFMYAGDLADYIAMSIRKFDELPQLMNVGVGGDHTIYEYYHEIADIVDYQGRFEYDLSKPVGMKQKLVDISEQKKLGWMPRTTLADGISKTVEFYIQNGRGGNYK